MLSIKYTITMDWRDGNGLGRLCTARTAYRYSNYSSTTLNAIAYTSARPCRLIGHQLAAFPMELSTPAPMAKLLGAWQAPLFTIRELFLWGALLLRRRHPSQMVLAPGLSDHFRGNGKAHARLQSSETSPRSHPFRVTAVFAEAGAVSW